MLGPEAGDLRALATRLHHFFSKRRTPEGSLIQALARGRCYSLFWRPIFYSVVDGSAVVAMERRSKARWRTVAA